jgi:hypothetical protein
MEPPYNGGKSTTRNLYERKKEGIMPRKGSKHPYKPKREYTYSVKDIADLGGMTRNALNVAKAHGKIDPGDFKSVVSFLIRRIIANRLEGNLFGSATRAAKRVMGGKSRAHVSGKRPKKRVRRK